MTRFAGWTVLHIGLPSVRTNRHNLLELDGLFVFVACESPLARYVLASSLHMSGVMAVRPNLFPHMKWFLSKTWPLFFLQVLFCGVTMSHYTQHNLSVEARAATRHIFEAFAYTTNIFLFAYIGFVSSSADVFTRAVVVLAFSAV